MAQDYYTLEEAAQIAKMSPDELKQLARKGTLRSFQDRGTWRFRVQDIQELARTRGVGSDPELVLGEALVPKPTDSPAPRSPAVKSREAEVFDFTLESDEEDIGIGTEFLGAPGGSSRKQPSSRNNPKSGPKSGGPPSPGPKSPGPKSPVPPPGSDSDVRLVADGSDLDFQLQLDSDAKLVDDPLSGPQAKLPPRGKTGMSGPPSPSKLGPTSPAKLDPKRRTGMTPGTPPVDSGVRLVPMDSDSDVRIVGAGSDEVDLNLGKQPPKSSTDSDIRLERVAPPSPGSDEGLLTEEINLDEEMQKEAARKSSPQAKVRPKPPSQPALPTSSPFELSESDLNLPAAPDDAPPGDKPDSSDFDLTPAAESPLKDSSDFELTPAGDSSSPLEPSSDEDFRLELPDDEVGLGEAAPASDLSGPRSGISLDNPVDSGISLEQGGEGSDEIEFTLSLDAESTPKPGSAAAKMSTDSSSEFELTLDSDETGSPVDESSSEFELTLDSDEKPAGGDSSDSEFELTLDDSGGLSPLEEEEPQAKVAGDKDIFDTDFDVPALEEESGSEAMALEEADTGLESSDFDLELGDEDIASEEESGSQVIALDEEEADDAAMTQQALKTRGRRRAAAASDEEVEELDDDAAQSFADIDADVEVDQEELVEEDYDEEPSGRTVVKEKLLPAAPWGAMPVVLMLPCVLVMALVVLLGFELVQSMNGYKSPGLLTRALGDLLGQKFK